MSTATEAIRSITLYFKGAGSDKIYHLEIVPERSGYLVNGISGARGGTMVSRPQTPNGPISLEEAERIFNKQVDAKKHHRKTPYIEGPPMNASYVPPENTDARELQPQLLSAIEDTEAAVKVAIDSEHCVMEKYDGIRMFLVAESKTVAGLSRTNKGVSLTTDIERQAKALANIVGPVTLDGEYVNDTYYAFDILSHDGRDLRPDMLDSRLVFLTQNLLTLGQKSSIQRSSIAIDEMDKRALIERLYHDGKEGIVIKNLTSPYLPGRQKDQFKHKFWSTASVLVTGKNAKNSVRVAVFDPDTEEEVPLGSVTIRNPLKPKEGDILEVRYLNWQEGGSLYQATMMSIRDDVTIEACTMEQLHVKGAPRK